MNVPRYVRRRGRQTQSKAEESTRKLRGRRVGRGVLFAVVFWGARTKERELKNARELALANQTELAVS